jgi:hypothetical protein
VPVLYFLLFLCFRKVTPEIFSELDETKAKHPEIYRSFPENRRGDEEGPQGSHTTRGRGLPLARAHLW